MELTIKTAKEQLQYLSESASDVCRKLVFATYAVAWLFRINNSGHLTIPTVLTYSTIFATIALMMDLAQYIYGTASLHIQLNKHNLSEENSVIKIDISGTISSMFFYSKIFFTSSACIFILYFFIVTFL